MLMLSSIRRLSKTVIKVAHTLSFLRYLSMKIILFSFCSEEKPLRNFNKVKFARNITFVHNLAGNLYTCDGDFW